jgi:hypothetical protein
MLLNMESVYHFVTIRVNETSWAHVWRLRSLFLGTGYDIGGVGEQLEKAAASEMLVQEDDGWGTPVAWIR